MLPRAIPDPAYLRRLRERALRRLQQEEQTIARRTTLQRLGLVFSGLALFRGKRALAVGPRCSAPQYGAPGMSASTRMIPPLDVSLTHDDLKSLVYWKQSSVVIIPESKPAMLWGPSSQAYTISYRLPSGEALPLSIIETKSGTSYVVRANEAFYASDGTDLLGCRFLGSELIVVPSIFKLSTPLDRETGVIAQFARKVDDKALEKAASPAREIHIDLAKGVPEGFWTDSTRRNPGDAYPFIYSAGVIDGVLEFSCHGTGTSGGNSGTFTVDLKAKKLLKFVPFK